MNDLVRHTAIELAAMIRRGEVSSREVIDAHLARIDEVNGTVNAVTVTMADEARAAADAADAALAAGDEVGPLHGLPVTIKENIDVAGGATTDGLPALEGAIAPIDGPVVERLRAAGAIPFARTNQPELAYRLDTENPLRGRTHNPFRQNVTPGGSSGGEGAALATGMSPFGMGNDIGGSVRNPAYACGVVGHRPTMGRIPRAMSIPPLDPPMCAQTMATNGPMARSVADVRLGLDILNGSHWRSPNTVDVAVVGPPLERRVAAVVDTGTIGAVDPATAAAVHAAGDALAADGWTTERVEFPELERVNEIWLAVMSADVSVMLPLVEEIVSPELKESLVGLVELDADRAMPMPVVWGERHRLMRVWSEFFLDYPVVISPVWPSAPFASGADIGGGFDFVLRYLQFVCAAPLLALPSVALPTGLQDGLPTGVQIHADRWRDDWALQAAATIEAAMPPITPVDPVT